MHAEFIPESSPRPWVVQVYRVGKEWKLISRDDKGAPFTVYFTAAHPLAPDTMFGVRVIRRCGSLAIPVPPIALTLVRALSAEDIEAGTWIVR